MIMFVYREFCRANERKRLAVWKHPDENLFVLKPESKKTYQFIDTNN